MSKVELKEMLTRVEELGYLPSAHPMRLIPTALREYADRLVEHVVVGSTEAKPFTWKCVLTIGNLEAVSEVAWGAYPPLEDAVDYVGLDFIKAALKKECAPSCGVEILVPLKRTGILTGAVALYGEDAKGEAVLLIGRHPDLTRAKAVHLLLTAIKQAEEKAASAAS